MNFVLHKKCMFFIFCIITILLLSRALRIEVANSSNTRYHIYSVEFNYYGMDAKRIEKAITIPLEEKIMKMNNLAEFSSVIEHNQSVTSAYFYKKANTKTTYLELRSIVENIYTSLPHSVQKPRIYTSDSKSSNILCIAFTDENISKEMLETKFKNQLLSIDGVSEVNISGGTSMEVLVNFDPSELIYLQQEPANLSKKINEANETAFSSMMKFGKENLSIYAKTKINSLEELNLLPIKIGDSTRELKSFSNVSFSERKQDEITRINGKECSAINIKSSNGNIIAISKKCKTIIEKSGISKNSYTVLYDLGERQYSLIKSVVIALAQSFICVLFVIPFFFSSKIFFKGIFFLLVSTCTWTLGLLQYFGYSLNQHTIAGISISLGLIIDSSLVIFSVYEQSRNKIAFIEKLQKTQLTLCSATFTTALASIPLFFLETIVPGAKTIAISILFMLICSMILSQIFLPCYLYQDREEKQKYLIARKAEVFYTRLSYILALQSIKRKKIIKVIYMGFVFFPILFIIISEKNLSRKNDFSIISASINFNGEERAQYIDKEIEKFIKKISEYENITFVKTDVKKGSANIEIGHSAKNQRSIVRYINSCAELLSSGFLYIHAEEENKSGVQLELAIVGDDSTLCKQYAKEVLKYVEKNIDLSSGVLNFKNAEREIVFIPDGDILINNDLSVKSVAMVLRYYLFAPVVSKWIRNNREYDIRVTGLSEEKRNFENFERLQILSGSLIFP